MIDYSVNHNQQVDLKLSKNPATQSVIRIALASFIGTTIEFYDFYIYGMASALVIGPVFVIERFRC